jgi:uncharacterized protein (TIGR01777 family)
MAKDVFVRRCRVDAPAEEVFRWHTRPGALERLTPPWEPVEVVERSGGVGDGDRAVLRMRMGPFRRRWVAEHRDYQEGHHFRDVQVAGPFASWEHTHTVQPEGAGTCTIEDRIEYALPLGPVGRLLGGGLVRRKLERAFAYRHEVLRHDLAAHARAGKRALSVLVSGARGLVGSALVPFLTTGGHQVMRLTRSAPRPLERAVAWDPAKGALEGAALEGFDAVVHLAGESIASGRWTAAKKARIRDSRVEGTRLLATALSRLSRPPGVLVCASAIGYYGDRGEEVLTEESGSGGGFLAEVCREWEAAADPARDKGIRVVHLRFGVIFSPAGGALAAMLVPFRLGAGGRVGSGRQYLSWIALDDAVGVIHHSLVTADLSGPVNAVAPSPVTNREFTKTLGRVLGWPTLFPVPALGARLAFGEMANELLLASTLVQPARLLASGYPFRYPELGGALRHLLGKEHARPG